VKSLVAIRLTVSFGTFAHFGVGEMRIGILGQEFRMAELPRVELCRCYGRPAGESGYGYCLLVNNVNLVAEAEHTELLFLKEGGSYGHPRVSFFSGLCRRSP
jgi:hypothetical protein